MFEKATRMRLRFDSKKGTLSVEDLWDLSRTMLNEIYMELNRKAKKATEESLMDDLSVENKRLILKIEIVKYIFNLKKEEAKAFREATQKKEYKQKLLEIKARKQDENLENMSEEELDALITGLS